MTDWLLFVNNGVVGIGNRRGDDLGSEMISDLMSSWRNNLNWLEESHERGITKHYHWTVLVRNRFSQFHVRLHAAVMRFNKLFEFAQNQHSPANTNIFLRILVLLLLLFVF